MAAGGCAAAMSGGSGHPRGPVQAAGASSATTLSPGTGDLSAVTFSPDGTLLACGAAGDGTANATVWNVRTGKIGLTLGGAVGGVGSLAFSPDGQTLGGVVVDASGLSQVVFWDARTGAAAGSLDVSQVKQAVDQGIRVLAFSPDGQTVATGSGNGDVHLWHVASGALSSTLAGHTDAITGLCFASNGLALASGSWDRAVRLWNVADGTVSRSLAAPHKVNSIVFGPDGRSLFAGTGEGGLAAGSVRKWDIATGGLVEDLAGNTGYVVVALGSNGETLASADTSGSVLLWDAGSGARTASLTSANPVAALAYSPAEPVLAAGEWEGTVELWRL